MVQGIEDRSGPLVCPGPGGGTHRLSGWTGNPLDLFYLDQLVHSLMGEKKLLAAEYSKNGNLWNGWTGSLAALLGHGIFDIWLIGFILIREKYFSIM